MSAYTNYDSIQALNWSTLKYLATSALLYKWRLTHPEPRKQAYITGLAGHCKILEPEAFDDRFGVYEKRRAGAAWDTWKDAHPGVQSLTPGEMAVVEHIADAVHSHPEARALLAQCRVEEPLVWTDPDTGLKCKGRVDMLSISFVGDLKTTRNVDPWRFARDARDYMYDGQLAHYHTGAVTLRKISGKETPWIIAAQNCEPFDVVVYRMKPDDLDSGRQLGLRLQRRLQECQAADWWPGCAPGVQYLDIPPRHADREQEESF